MDNHLEQWLADEVPPDVFTTLLPDTIAGLVIERLKDEVDRNWSLDLDRAFELASRIVTIGHIRKDIRQEALGIMAQGDILKYQDHFEDAWNKLDEAGKMFETSGDDVGWARTRIGRIVLGLKLNRLHDVLIDVDRARQIFRENDEQEKLVRLDINTAYIYSQLGDQRKALSLNCSALKTAEELGVLGQRYVGLLHMNIGFAHEFLGGFQEALSHYKQASSLFHARNETRYIANIDLNIAYIAHAQGQYRQALQLVYGILERGIDQFPLEAKAIKRDLIEFYLYLNRHSDARDLARQVIDDYRGVHATYDVARVLLHLATAEVELDNFTAALTALDEAESIFRDIKAITWMMITRLQRGQVALRQGNLVMAREDALVTTTYFQEKGHKINYAASSLFTGQVAIASGGLDSATSDGNQALYIAQRYNIPTTRYGAHLLLGQVAEAKSTLLRAKRHYQAAAATIDRIQRGLTITLRSGFLEDKGDAWRRLIALYLRLGQVDSAFDALERSKSQVLLDYIANREQFRWARNNNPENEKLILELNHLRAEHQSYYRLVHNLPKDQEYLAAINPEHVIAEIANLERRMRNITEQLYLNSGSTESGTAPAASLQDIQCLIDSNTLLIEFYSDDDHLWAFTLDGQSCKAYQLPIAVESLNQLLVQLRTNIDAALKLDSRSPFLHSMTQLGQRILRRLYSGLLEPLGIKLHGQKRLIIVPYGTLHYLPFNLLYDGSAYLIDRFEIVILPAASLITRPGPIRTTGSLILSHSWNGHLPNTHKEARKIHQLFGGVLLKEGEASRTALQMPPTQVLHIAAHGQYRLDQPDFSYIELADGQLYADDLLQQDLSYELVTLSACETGRVKVAADEELIGIGRGLLYAGAGALILSLWQVADTSTVHLMDKMYGELHRGKTKAAAIRSAQRSIRAKNKELHPAFWGAFQLIGDARPLSTAR